MEFTLKGIDKITIHRAGHYRDCSSAKDPDTMFTEFSLFFLVEHPLD